MGKSLKYVSDFSFPSECGFSGSAGKTMVKSYARGGKVSDMAQDKAMVKAAVHKHEKAKHAGQPLTKLARGGSASVKDAVRNEREEMSRIKQETRSERKDAGQEMSRVRREMRYDEQKMKGAQPVRKQYPTDRREPMIAMKAGGMAAKKEAKIGKVMGEYKAGELHSGSKTGPVVKDRKQALAIAMSEARKKK
jgi:hypothetical protein